MPRLSASLLLCLGLLGPSASGQTADLAVTSSDRLLILAPHPDDEVLCCGGLIQKAVEEHLPIRVVFLTYGDYNKWAFSIYRRHPVFRPKAMREMGEVRRQEALAAAGVLGIPSDQLLFLGYPDFETLTIWTDHWGGSPALESRHTRVRAVPYPTAYRPGAAYKGEEILHDLKAILHDFRPTKIILPHPKDEMPDHQALYLFARKAVEDGPKESSPRFYTYLVHFHNWPSRRGFHPGHTLTPPARLRTETSWANLSLTPAQVEKKHAALEKHRTECNYSDGFLTSFVRANELFGEDAGTASVFLPGQDSNLQPSR